MSLLINEEVESKLKNYLEYKNFDSVSTKMVLDSIDNKYGLDITLLSSKVFNNPTKKHRKFLIDLFQEKNPDISVLKIFKILSYNLNVNKDLILNNYENFKFNKRNTKYLTISIVKELFEIYSHERTIKLLLNDSLNNLKDIIYMINTIKKKRDLSFLPNKPTTLKDIHDCLSRMIMKLKEGNFDLEQRDDILKLDGHKINKNLIIRVPKEHYDLIDLGEDLNFCIGNGYYSKEVLKGSCSIVAIYDNKSKPLYGIQFNRYAISQAYGFDNKVIPNDILLAIQKALISEPKVPEDFIAINDSTWINGYKYNDNDLFIMMNNKIYVYFNVEQYVYEELISSSRKGSYVNQFIKGNYESKRVDN